MTNSKIALMSIPILASILITSPLAMQSAFGIECTEPKTLGYWKNHSSEVESLLTSNGPAQIGNHLVNDVAGANAIFDAAKSKNAYDMLAAQVLALWLNYHSGACVCTEVSDAWQTAVLTYLIPAGYNGPETTTAPEKETKSEISDIKDIIDNFNNGFLCEP